MVGLRIWTWKIQQVGPATFSACYAKARAVTGSRKELMGLESASDGAAFVVGRTDHEFRTKVTLQDIRAGDR